MRTAVPLGLGEQTEIETYVTFVTGPPAPVRESPGISSPRVCSALAPAIRAEPLLQPGR